jgi:cyclase
VKRAIPLLLFSSLLIFAFFKTGMSQPSLVHELAPGVFVRLADPDKRIIANTGWVVFRDYVLVIDANYPWGARAILADLRKTTNKPVRFAFDTHYHADHSFGNSVFVDAGATIVCSQDCAEESRRKNPAAWTNDKGSGEFDLKQWRLEHPQASFPDRMVFDDGEHRVELNRVGPAHTLGDSVAWLPKERILFTGDLCTTSAANNLADPDANPERWVTTLDGLEKMDIATLIPGHGPIGNRASIQPQRKYLAAMIEGVKTGIAAGKSADEVSQSLDLTSHHPNGDNAAGNRVSIRAVYNKLKH